MPAAPPKLCRFVVIGIALGAGDEGIPTMQIEEIAVLRTQLRHVNIEYSALVRTKGGDDRFMKMDELRSRRHALMALIAQTAPPAPLRAPPGNATPDAVVQAA